jgi:predicted PurR-regulated permease PerM
VTGSSTAALEPSTNQQRLITLASSVIVIAALYLAKQVLIPFALAVLLSFLLAPVVARLQRWGVPRIPAVVTAVLLVFAITGAVGWLVANQAREVGSQLPQYRENIRSKAEALRDRLEKPFRQARETVKDLRTDLVPEEKPTAAQPQAVRVVAEAPTPWKVLGDLLNPLLGIVTTAAMVLLFAFVILLRREDLRDRFIRLAGNGQIYVTTQALNEASAKVSSYLARQLLLNGLHGAMVAIGLLLIGLPNALLWGLIAALLRFIPYAGPWISATFPFLMSVAISEGWTQPLLVIGLIAVLELVSNNFLEPWIYGKGTGISPLALLVSALFWTWLWGPVGLFLATPLTVCLVVMGKYVPQFHFLYLLFGDAPVLPPPARLYQRLLAGDQDEAWTVVKEALSAQPLVEVYDTVILPALAMAEHDRQRGTLDSEAGAHIRESLELLLSELRETRLPDNVAAESAPPTALRDLRVLVMPARNAADALAAALLRHVLERDGVQVTSSPLAELAGETLAEFEQHPADVVCISAVPPSRFMHVRYLCKRLTGRFPDLEIVVGMWTLQLEESRLAERVPQDERVHTVSTLAEARARLLQLAEPLRIRREAARTGAGSAAAGS